MATTTSPTPNDTLATPGAPDAPGPAAHVEARLSHGLLHRQPPIFEQGASGRSAASLPPAGVPAADPAKAWPANLLRAAEPTLPEVSELEVVRHFSRLSQWNVGIDTTFYPLGSCTMKYNPRINEHAARNPDLADLHPQQPLWQLEGALDLMDRLERCLAEIGGFARVTLQPAAGAHGELAGVMMMRAYHEKRGDKARRKILIPDSAHGTNPATCTLNGFEVVQIATGPRGILEVADVDAAIAKHPGQVAGIMVTNPNTCGLFEENFAQIAERIHAAGGLVYMDGANLNALVGKARPGDMGVDAMHINLHKTFTTPHGGGGPGAGPVGVSARLEPFLPVPLVHRTGDAAHPFALLTERERPDTIGRVRAAFGNYGMLVRAYTYIREMGAQGLRRGTEMAVLNANYLRARLGEAYHVVYDRPCMHEVILSDKRLKKETGLVTLDVAKRLMDLGYHPPTVYFPLVVPGAIMIEPTETESPETLNGFAEAMIAIAREAHATPDKVHGAPTRTPMQRLDETRAARKPVLRWKKGATAAE
jgi:glycine dehydrogenase subunit 2